MKRGLESSNDPNDDYGPPPAKKAKINPATKNKPLLKRRNTLSDCSSDEEDNGITQNINSLITYNDNLQKEIEEFIKSEYINGINQMIWSVDQTLDSAFYYDSITDQERKLDDTFWNKLAFGSISSNIYTLKLKYHVTRYGEINLDKSITKTGGFTRCDIFEFIHSCFTKSFSLDEIKLIQSKYYDDEKLIQDAFEYISDNLIPLSHWKNIQLKFDENGKPNWPLKPIIYQLNKLGINDNCNTNKDYWDKIKKYMESGGEIKQFENEIDAENKINVSPVTLIGDAVFYEGFNIIDIDEQNNTVHLHICCGS